ncbi:MAG TPA: flagellar hook protein FlgE [Janthinobacterium sp.]|nr:flagellar hook protein FlgE [Janthinobacterium sp.]
MSFQQGLSGLNGAAKSLDVIGNNIANASTVGFKGSQTDFADIYANSLSGATGSQAGIGVSVSTIAQQFTQGSLETTANPLDIAINGGGFFRTSVNGAIQYSRNGQFQMDKNGFIINAQLAQITGYVADATGKILAGAPVPIKINPGDMPPQATTKINTQVNLDSRVQMPTTVPFDANNTDSYNKQIPTNVYDSLGNAHVMSTFYVKTGGSSWDIYVASDSQEITSMKVAATVQTDPAAIAARAAFQTAVTTVPLSAGAVIAAAQSYATAAGTAVTTAATAAGASAAQLAAIAATYVGPAAASQNGGFTPDQIDAAIDAAVNVPAVKAGSLIFNSTGTLDRTAMLALVPPQTLPINVSLPIFPATGATPLLAMALDLTGSTQIAAAFSEKSTVQDGYAGGQLTSFASDANGVILGQYSNGRTRALAQIVLANFTDPNGLQPLGNNAFAETSASGGPLVGTPNTGSLGTLRSSSTESSNVDLTAELVNMITAQRAYQANAQTIKTQDQVLQTLVSLR